MSINNGNMGVALRAEIDAFFAHKYGRHKILLDKHYKPITSKKAMVECLSIAGFSTLAPRAQLAATELEDPTQGYLVQIEAQSYAKGYGIAEETLDDDIHGVAANFTDMLMEAAAETENVLSHVPLNDGFVTAAADGQPLFSASQPKIGGGTWSNLISPADPSMLLLEDLFMALADAQDDNGKQIILKPMAYAVPTEMAWTTKQVLESPSVPGAGNEALNPAQGMCSWFSSPYLSDPDASFLFTDCPSGGVAFKRKKPFLRHDNDESTLGRYTYLHMRMTYTFLNKRWAFASAGV